ncbi:hypothetical protein YC2023_111296 [Brassica napus]
MKKKLEKCLVLNGRLNCFRSGPDLKTGNTFFNGDNTWGTQLRVSVAIYLLLSLATTITTTDYYSPSSPPVHHSPPPVHKPTLYSPPTYNPTVLPSLVYTPPAYKQPHSPPVYTPPTYKLTLHTSSQGRI